MKQQKEAVYGAVCEVLNKTTFTEKVQLNADQRKLVVELIAKGLEQGEITLSDKARQKHDTLEKLQKDYVPGLLSNWLNKDQRLNGGNQPKKVSKTSKLNKAIKKLNSYKRTLSDPDQITAVEEEIKETKKAAIEEAFEIDFDITPEDLTSDLLS